NNKISTVFLFRLQIIPLTLALGNTTKPPSAPNFNPQARTTPSETDNTNPTLDDKYNFFKYLPKNLLTAVGSFLKSKPLNKFFKKISNLTHIENMFAKYNKRIKKVQPIAYIA